MKNYRASPDDGLPLPCRISCTSYHQARSSNDSGLTLDAADMLIDIIGAGDEEALHRVFQGLTTCLRNGVASDRPNVGRLQLLATVLNTYFEFSERHASDATGYKEGLVSAIEGALIGCLDGNEVFVRFVLNELTAFQLVD